ncbi:MAG: hypothetical protein NVS3B11_08380 [Collimonas sp.]
MGKWCCMYINEFHQDDSSTCNELEAVEAEKDFTPEELAVLSE